jgi:hypothetical protein
MGVTPQFSVWFSWPKIQHCLLFKWPWMLTEVWKNAPWAGFPLRPLQPPEHLRNPATRHKRKVSSIPRSCVTKPPTEILTLQVKCRQYQGRVRLKLFVKRLSLCNVSVLNPSSQGCAKCFAIRERPDWHWDSPCLLFSANLWRFRWG